MSDDIKELEKEIGFPPWTNTTREIPIEKHSLAREWLCLNEMTRQKANSLKKDQIERCYGSRNYFLTVVGKRPRSLKVNAAHLLTDEVVTHYNTIHDETWSEISDGNIPQPEKITVDATQTNPQDKNWLNILEKDLEQKAKELEKELEKIIQQKAKDLAETYVKEFLKKQETPRPIVITNPHEYTHLHLGHQHRDFETLIRALGCRLHIMLVGTASSSKTTSAKMAAKALNIPFYHMGAASSEFKFAGYEDGNGKYHTTPFRMAFENGGLILLDEYDASIPAATMFIQSALANGTCHFPDKIIEAHENFYCMVACNTYGRGSDRQYTSRNQQDAAALDRFVVLDWDIDEDLEAKLFGDGHKEYQNSSPPSHFTLPNTIAYTPGDWVRRVQTIRKTINELGERHLVTMRASDYGARLLKNGFTLEQTEKMTVWKGINQTIIDKIKHHAKLYYPQPQALNTVSPVQSGNYIWSQTDTCEIDTHETHETHETHSIDLRTELWDAIYKNEKVDAIKVYRTIHPNVSLYEAKANVEKLISDHCINPN